MRPAGGSGSSSDCPGEGGRETLEEVQGDPPLVGRTRPCPVLRGHQWALVPRAWVLLGLFPARAPTCQRRHRIPRPHHHHLLGSRSSRPVPWTRKRRRRENRFSRRHHHQQRRRPKLLDSICNVKNAKIVKSTPSPQRLPQREANQWEYYNRSDPYILMDRVHQIFFIHVDSFIDGVNRLCGSSRQKLNILGTSETRRIQRKKGKQNMQMMDKIISD